MGCVHMKKFLVLSKIIFYLLQDGCKKNEAAADQAGNFVTLRIDAITIQALGNFERIATKMTCKLYAHATLFWTGKMELI